MDLKAKRSCLLIALLYFAGLSSGCISRFALTRISVVDEETGKPITNVTVNCSYHCISFDVSGKSGSPNNTCWYEKTGSDNVKWILGHGSSPEVSAWLTTAPAGYYKGDGSLVNFWPISYLLPLPIWLPPFRNIQISALKKENPVYLFQSFVKDPRIEWRRSDKSTNNIAVEYAFDCFQGDWCPPHGQGESRDLIFSYSHEHLGQGQDRHGKAVNYYKKQRRLTFSNPGDGIVVYRKSDSNVPAKRPVDLIAPVDGYVSEHSSYFECSPTSNWSRSDESYINFYFRIRSKFNSEGVLVGGHYGKLSGRYSFYLGMDAEYFVNPTPLDTNLEY